MAIPSMYSQLALNEGEWTRECVRYKWMQRMRSAYLPAYKVRWHYATKTRSKNGPGLPPGPFVFINIQMLLDRMWHFSQLGDGMKRLLGSSL